MLEALDFLEVDALPDNLVGNKGVLMYLRTQDRDYVPGLYHTHDGEWVLILRAKNPAFTGTMRGPRYGEVVQNVTATTANTTIDVSLGSYIVLNLNVNTAVTFTNLPPAVTAAGFTVEVVYGGRTLTFTQTVRWHAKTVPTQTPAGSDVFVFYSRDGATLIGAQAMKDIG